MPLLCLLKVLRHSRKGGGTFFFPADSALAEVYSNNHQVADVGSPDYSEHIGALRFSLLPLEPDTLFYYLYYNEVRSGAILAHLGAAESLRSSQIGHSVNVTVLCLLYRGLGIHIVRCTFHTCRFNACTLCFND